QGLDKTVLRVMEIAGAETDFVAQTATKWLGHPDGGFEELPLAVQRRCLHLQLVRHSFVPNFDLIEELRLNANRLISIHTAPSNLNRNLNRKPQTESKSARGKNVLVSRDSAGLVHFRPAESSAFE